MSRYHLEVRVKPRPGLLEPEGKAIHHALESLGFSGVADVRVGKVIDLELDAGSPEAAVEAAEEMCRKLLANPVMEDYEIQMAGDDVPEGA